MAIVQTLGELFLFTTFTANPNWREIRNNAEHNQYSDNRPEPIAIVFKSNRNELSRDIKVWHVRQMYRWHIYDRISEWAASHIFTYFFTLMVFPGMSYKQINWSWPEFSQTIQFSLIFSKDRWPMGHADQGSQTDHAIETLNAQKGFRKNGVRRWQWLGITS